MFRYAVAAVIVAAFVTLVVMRLDQSRPGYWTRRLNLWLAGLLAATGLLGFVVGWLRA